MNILISGFCGKMGQTVFNQAKNFNDINVVEGFDRQEAIDDYRCEVQDLTLISNINDAKRCDVVVDFSHFSVLNTVLDYCVKNKKPLVLATTGIRAEDEQNIINASKVVPIFRSSNMSEGVFVLLSLIKKATNMLEGWDIEIIEKHHSHKADAPSGTGIMMLNEVKSERKNVEAVYGRNKQSGKRTPQEVGIHAVRGGGVVGEHEIDFFNEHETIKISHEAFSKGIFADGALKACKFIFGKEPGLYGMKNLFE